MQTATTALRVLDEVARSQPIGVTEVARRLDLPKSSAQRALRALEAAGWVRRSTTERTGWLLTTKAIDIAARVAADTGVREAAQDVMEHLRDQTGESVHLAIRERHEVVVIDSVETVNPTRIHIPIGTRSPLHATATGKSILAHLDEQQRADVVAAGLGRFTAVTITDPELLIGELDAIRSGRRCATAKGELRDDIASIAAPVLSGAGWPICAISVFIPLYRFPPDDGVQIGRLVVAAAEEIAQRLSR